MTTCLDEEQGDAIKCDLLFHKERIQSAVAQETGQETPLNLRFVDEQQGILNLPPSSQYLAHI